MTLCILRSMNFSSGNCLQIQFIAEHQVSFASSIGTISIQCVCYAVVVLLCSCRVKDRRVVAMFKYYSAILWLEWKFLAFWITGSSTFFKSFRVSLEEFYLSTRKLEVSRKNTYVFEHTHNFLYKTFVKQGGVLEVAQISHQCCSANSGCCDFSLPGRHISRKTLTANPLLCIPSSTKK